MITLKIYADIEADRENDNSCVGKKTTINFKQNPVWTCSHIVSELGHFLQNGYYKSPLGYNNVNWLVIEKIKIEKKMTFFFKKTKIDYNDWRSWRKFWK